MSKALQWFRAGAFLWAWLPLVATAAEPVAMVTDLQGEVAENSGNTPRPLEIMSELATGNVISVPPGGSVTLVFFTSGNESRLAGPARARVSGAGLENISGQPPSERALVQATNNEQRVALAPLSQAGLVMRSGRSSSRIRILSPLGTRTWEARPEFRWLAVPGAPAYRFQLFDGEGETLHEVQLTDTRYRVPDSIRLQPGEPYTWEIEARLENGRKYSNWADFEVADEQIRNRVERARPAADAGNSELIVFAMILEQLQLRDEARAVWRRVSELEPGNRRIRELAGY